MLVKDNPMIQLYTYILCNIWGL